VPQELMAPANTVKTQNITAFGMRDSVALEEYII
jgi:hypothetical protein